MSTRWTAGTRSFYFWLDTQLLGTVAKSDNGLWAADLFPFPAKSTFHATREAAKAAIEGYWTIPRLTKLKLTGKT